VITRRNLLVGSAAMLGAVGVGAGSLTAATGSAFAATNRGLLPARAVMGFRLPGA
jgi:hypothetical protein